MGKEKKEYNWKLIILIIILLIIGYYFLKSSSDNNECVKGCVNWMELVCFLQKFMIAT